MVASQANVAGIERYETCGYLQSVALQSRAVAGALVGAFMEHQGTEVPNSRASRRSSLGSRRYLEALMPVFVGFILGVVVTILGAYMYDAATGNVDKGLSASTQAPMVNWSVVKSDWEIFESNVRATADNIERTFKQRSS
jgi:hypothetical protein